MIRLLIELSLMKRKLLIFFALCFVPTYMIIWFTKQRLNQEGNDNLSKQVSIIRESVSERFNLFLNTSKLAAMFAAQQFSKTPHLDEVYLNLGRITTERFPEVLALNVVDLSGRIVKVYPESINKIALEKTSQNYKSLLEFSKSKKPYWFSSPFDLYQGEEGFSFYVPYYQEGAPAGWVALVISSKTFFEHFKLEHLLENYHLVIRDKESGRDYFSTHELPDIRKIYSETFQSFNRELVYYLWPIENQLYRKLKWGHCFLIALLCTSFFTFSYYLYIQRQETKKQLKKINTLITYTAEEATSTLTGIYNELNLMGKETGYVSTEKMVKYIHYITTLLDQISIAEKFIDPRTQPEFNFNNIRPLLTEQLDMLKDKFSDKHLKIEFDESSYLTDFAVWSNKWLLCHSVLGNVLRIIHYYSKKGSTAKITFYEEEDFYFLSINNESIEDKTDEFHSEIMDRCLVIAREVAKLSKAEIDIFHRPIGSKTIVLKFQKGK